ncbi:hypothetical protein FHR32_001568 [Streptosporangium album]|uniref:DUF1702 family protein n=1 Tax=Streptosporangium album TaxID=47479 RepID=A0A7W7RSA0_9ACTN|nr:DUF1702 family protein [Streptosporangium album]MBB4937263.1 hypothetical protein [Streptosporangium album]
MSNAEGTRTVAQSDGVGQAAAEKALAMDRVRDNGGTGVGETPEAERVSDMEITAEMERVPYPEETGTTDVLVAGKVSGTRESPGGENVPAKAEPPRCAEKAGAPETPSPERFSDATADPAAPAPPPAIAPAVPVPAVPTVPVDPAELELTRPRGLPGLFWQDLAQIDSGPRRFRLGPARERLETANQSFLTGFNAMVADEVERIEDIHEELRGSAYEGAGMACAMLDVLTVTGGRRLRGLLSGPGMRHPHMVHLGTGWAYARLRMRPMWGIRSVHPLLRWLAYDGFGFHQGFFSTDRTVGRQRTAGLMDRTRRAIFDQGLGRMLWFHECAGADDVILRIAEFPPGRRADLWSGVGMAATYTGGASTAELERLSAAAAEDGFRAHLAQGGAFACACRLISGIVPEHTVAATPTLCGVEVDEAASWTDTALVALGHNAHSGDHYQAWRAGIRKAWARRNRD